VTTADVALYILNNKRAFVTDMERRYGVVIAVQASDRMQGANFAIERSAAQVAPQRAAERAVVNMESGFERQEGEEDVREDAEEATERGDGEGGRRPRRRRRRGRRDERGDDRPPHREHRGGERAEHTHNDEVEDVGPEPAAYADQPEAAEDLADEPTGNLAGLGEQPSVTHGENGREDRPGRRRRRGRRGGRRGRDRDDAPREHSNHEHGDDVSAHESDAGNGAVAPEVSRGAEAEPVHEESTAIPTAATGSEPVRSLREEPPYAPPERERAPERSWQAPAERYPSEPEAPRHVEPAPIVESPPPREPEPVHAQPAAEPEDPSRPVRKGWWQRKFSGE
jgi:ribonuclease E